ncbi:MAG: hypothetical protein GY913_12770 [Proteobacteria bacterium]|nr:hypothetical protein [Pseudomonadota bacterium]
MPAFALSLLFSLACTGTSVPIEVPGDSDEPVEPAVLGEEIYDSSRVLEIDIEMDADDWGLIRNQKRNLYQELTEETCLQQPFDSPYSWVSATVEIDGEVLENVAVRKKGLLGSVTPDRPSLKFRFDKYEEDRLFHGLTRLTFNNGRQDLSRLKSCMGYEIYAALGVESSRCSFAHITVNGEDLGVYSNVEPIKSEMLARTFGDGSGDLYEGTLSDFRTDWTGTFDDKEGSGDFSEIMAVTEVLESDPDDLIEALEPHLDVDQFIRTWAADGIVGHWDSYAGNTNNFYVYVDPSDGRLRFMPWGIDAILTGDEPFGVAQPRTVVANSALSQALYADDEGRALYWATMEEFLEVWSGEELADRVDEMQDLIKPYLADEYDNKSDWRAEGKRVREFVELRELAVLDELDDPPAMSTEGRAWPCLGEVGSVEVTFESTWGSYGRENTWAYGSGTFAYNYAGVDYPVTFTSAVLGEYETGNSVLLVTGQLETGANIAVYAVGTTEDMASVGTKAADWDTLTAYLLYDADGDYQNWATAAYLGGEVEVSEASEEIGSAYVASGEMIVWGAEER